MQCMNVRMRGNSRPRGAPAPREGTDRPLRTPLVTPRKPGPVPLAEKSLRYLPPNWGICPEPGPWIVLNARFFGHRATVLKETIFPVPGMRLLQNTLDQKHPELARLLLPTVEEIVTKAIEPNPRSRKEWLDRIKQRLAEGK